MYQGRTVPQVDPGCQSVRTAAWRSNRRRLWPGQGLGLGSQGQGQEQG